MYSSSLLTVGALASTAAATYDPRVLARMGGSHLEHDEVNVAARQDDALGDCTVGAFSLFNSVPTPTGELLSYLAEFQATADLSDPTALCEVTAVPTSLSSAYSSYDQAASSWVSEHADDISSVVEVCASVSDATISSIVEMITANGAGLSGCPTATATTTDGSSVGTASAPVVTVTSSGSVFTTVTTGYNNSTTSFTSSAPTTATTATSGGSEDTTTDIPTGGAPRATAGAIMAAAGVLGAAILI